MMLQIYNEGSLSRKIASRMRYAEERGKGSIASFFASIFNGKNIDRDIKIKQDERIRQEITNKYVESINIKVHELQKSPISKFSDKPPTAPMKIHFLNFISEQIIRLSSKLHPPLAV